MVIAYYWTMLILSILLTLTYIIMWHKHFDIHLTLIFSFIPLVCFGYLMLAMSTELSEAIVALRVTYIVGCYLDLFIMLGVFEMCRIKLKRWISAAFIAFSTIIYLSTLSIGKLPYFYKDVKFSVENGTGVLVKEYGFIHTVFIVMVLVYFAMSLSAMIYSYFKKKDVSHRVIYLLVIPIVISVLSHFLGRKLLDGVELIPLAFVIAQVTYLFIVNRMRLYDITDSAIDSLVQAGDTGLVSFDLKLNYLGSNKTARKFFPDFENMMVDMSADTSSDIVVNMMKCISDFRKDAKKDKFYYESNKHTYLCDVNDLYDGKRKRGYQFVITDDTKNQKYIRLLNSYNTDLKKQVAEKTEHIVEMHDKLIMSMATMVESRDNSTGGHIRRTSDVVRMLIEEMRNDVKFPLDEEFCHNLIKAAPMHDLGKIAVDDAILRKPGRFTDEEFEKMKTHAAEGAHIVHEILEGTDDINFHILAENVAHYHHERWDGSGYPDGLKGTEIPLEARIMAVADVYDALVSKRVYKESMSFEQADRIIMEGMGKHFDKELEKYYVKARPRLEAYYSELKERGE